MTEFDSRHLLPRVVHRDYFDTNGEADIDTQPEKFGINRALGHDLFAFIAHCDDLIRNVHLDQLPAMNLTIESAWQAATDNLRRIAFNGHDIQQSITEANNGLNWACWLGNTHTSACAVLPDLFTWCTKHLRADTFLVRIASMQAIFILQSDHLPNLQDFDKLIAHVVGGSDNLVSENWFRLRSAGMLPL